MNNIRRINGQIIEWTTNLFTGERIVNMTYQEYIKFLKDKYLPVEGDYFSNPNFKSKNKKIRKLKYGIFIHHIDSDKYLRLSNWRYAKHHPFSAQKSDRLIYCNLFEHMLLHFKIYLETKKISAFQAFDRIYREVLKIFECECSHWDSRTLAVKERVFEMENIFWYFIGKMPLLIQRHIN